jgi:RNA polymerase sigma-70 factor (ECF subfamily)
VDVITEIIQNCIRGHRDSQSKLYQMYAPGMFVVCQRYAHSREDAEDILQESFIKVFQHLSQFRFNGSFEGWMRRIMINTALQKYRSQTHLHVINDGGDHTNDHFVDEEISMHIEMKELIALVQQLPTAYRVVFNLYVFEGMKHKEIAAQMGITEGTSKSNLYDARQQLQKAILRNGEIAKTKILR